MDFLSLKDGSKRGYRNFEQFHGQQGVFDVVATLRPKTGSDMICMASKTVPNTSFNLADTSRYLCCEVKVRRSC